jgi:UDP-N-acetylglucosamine--N-acetylmuramyl-(pentapeptide) pyrophosphoryl-undecaprenol N-acetylglucosamine transferase
LSKQVAVSFDQVLKFFARGRATVTGYPVRQEFFQATRERGQRHFHLDSGLPVLTVFGGSQGANALNKAMRTNAPALLSEMQVIHICGARDYTAIAAGRQELPERLSARYHVFEYLIQDMPLALAAADVVVARAGAATLGEFPAVGVPSVLVPGLFAQGHQDKNADYMVTRGAALKLPESALATEFVPTLVALVHDQPQLARMSQATRRIAEPDAAKRIAALLQEYAA